MGPTEAPWSLCGVGSCLIPVETFNHSIPQIWKAQMSCLSSALTSPLPFTENCRRPRCRQPRSWRKPNTKFKLYKQVWPGFCDLFQVTRGEDRGVSGLGVQQLLACREVQQSSDVLCESEQTLLLQLSLANTRTRPWSTHRIRASLELQQPMELTPCVFCFHTFPDCDQYLYWAVWTLFLAYCYDLTLIVISAYFRIPGLDTFGFVYYENRRNFIPWTTARSISKE